MLLFDNALFNNLRHTERHIIILLKDERISQIPCLAFSNNFMPLIHVFHVLPRGYNSAICHFRFHAFSEQRHCCQSALATTSHNMKLQNRDESIKKQQRG